MALTPRSLLRSLAALAGALVLLVPSITRAAPTSTSRRPVGWDRITRPALPPPVLRADGAVYVPPELRIVPTLEPPGPVADDDAVEMDGSRGASGLRSAEPSSATSVGPNVRANDTSGDPPGITNSETTIAALGTRVLAAWNDGKNFSVTPGGTGYAYSSDGGLTWTDGGVPPVLGVSPRHEGDPVTTVDGVGNFYLSDLYTPDGTTSAIAVTKGSFSGTSFSFTPPVLVATTVSDFLDKEWMVADQGTGNVYISWTRFLATGGNQIEFTRSTTGGASWDPIQVLTSTAAENVQGSRLAVGPSGEVQIIYFVYDKTTGNNYMRSRRSTTFGTSFGPEVTLPTGPNGIFSNYGSGPAGYNRARGIGFPSLAIDRSGGINNGRVYATWEETFNFYFDLLGGLGAVAEVEGNDTPGTANPITIGQSVTGTMSSTADQDWFSFSGTAGQSVILYLVPGGAPSGDGFLRLFCGGGAVANRAMLSYIGFGTGLVVYTLPSTGTYYFRVLANSATIGNYVVYTGLDSPDPGDEVAKDTRDAILQTSPNGTAWNPRTIVNDDPPRFDNTFPEVAVDALGLVYVDWYDHHADPCGILTDVYYARSGDGGVTFAPSVKVNDGASVNWSLVSSNLAPNMGDYSALVSDGCNVYANFADGRQGTPDSWVAVISDCATPTQIALVRADAEPGRVTLRWFADGGGDLVATVYRAADGGAWTSLATVRPDGEGTLSYEDLAVAPGSRYGYRLGIAGSSGERFYGETWLDVPRQLDFVLRGALPNPASRDLDVSFSLPGSASARLELFDVGGRLIEQRTVSGEGAHVVRMGDGAGVRSGIYLVKLTLGSRTLTSRVAVVR